MSFIGKSLYALTALYCFCFASTALAQVAPPPPVDYIHCIAGLDTSAPTVSLRTASLAITAGCDTSPSHLTVSFGDGSTPVSVAKAAGYSSSTLTHSYTAAGTYTITITIESDWYADEYNYYYDTFSVQLYNCDIELTTVETTNTLLHYKLNAGCVFQGFTAYVSHGDGGIPATYNVSGYDTPIEGFYNYSNYNSRTLTISVVSSSATERTVTCDFQPLNDNTTHAHCI